MDQGVGWLIVILVWSLPFLVGTGLVLVLLFRHFCKKHPPLSALLLTVLSMAGIAGLLFLKTLLTSILPYTGLWP